MSRLRRTARGLLTVAGVTAALCGAVVADVANIPGGGVNEYQRTERRNDPEAWLGWLAAALTLACLAWFLIVWATRPDPGRAGQTGRKNRVRVSASAVVVAGSVGALVVVAGQMPAPGPSGGPDLSRPLMILAFALAALGGLAVAVGGLRRPGGDRGDRDDRPDRPGKAAVAGTAAAVPLLTAALAVGVVPPWTVGANTDAVTTDQPGPAAGVPKLAGTVAWTAGPSGSSRDAGPADGFTGGADSVRRALSFDPTRIGVLGTAGGLAMLDARGLRMLDPASGAQRWVFHRWDVRHFGPRHRSDAADVGSAAVSPDGRSLAMTVFVDTPRALFIDDLRARTRVWVFDTVSGRRRADFAVPDTARIVGVGRDRVMIHTRQGDEPETPESDTPEHGTLAAFTFEGATKWRYALGEGCRVARLLPVGHDLLTVASCRDESRDDDTYARYRLGRIDGSTGKPHWSWWITRDGTMGGQWELFQRVSVAVTGGTAIVDAREVYRREVRDVDKATVAHNLLGVRVTDGRTVWTRPDQRYGELRTDHPEELGSLHAAAGTAVFAENLSTGTGDGTRRATALRAFDARTGEETWSLDVPDIAVPNLNDSPGPAVLLRDGRLFMAYRELTAAGDSKGCAMATWNIATGERRDLIRTNPLPDETWCFNPASLEVVEVPGGVAVHVRADEPGIFVLR